MPKPIEPIKQRMNHCRSSSVREPVARFTFRLGSALHRAGGAPGGAERRRRICPGDAQTVTAGSVDKTGHLHLRFSEVVAAGRMAWQESEGFRYRFDPSDGSVWFDGPADCPGMYSWQLSAPQRDAPRDGWRHESDCLCGCLSRQIGDPLDRPLQGFSEACAAAGQTSPLLRVLRWEARVDRGSHRCIETSRPRLTKRIRDRSASCRELSTARRRSD